MNQRTDETLDKKTINIELIGGCRDGETATKSAGTSLLDATRYLTPGLNGGLGFAALWEASQGGTLNASFRVSPVRSNDHRCSPVRFCSYFVASRTETDSELIIKCRA